MKLISTGQNLSLYQISEKSYRFNDDEHLIPLQAYMRVPNSIEQDEVAQYIDESTDTFPAWDCDNGFGIFGEFDDVKQEFENVIKFLQDSLGQLGYENDLNSYSYVDCVCLFQVQGSDLGVIIGSGYYEAAIEQQNAFIGKLMEDTRFIVVEAGAEHDDHSPVEVMLELIEDENIETELAEKLKEIFYFDEM